MSLQARLVGGWGCAERKQNALDFKFDAICGSGCVTHDLSTGTRSLRKVQKGSAIETPPLPASLAFVFVALQCPTHLCASHPAHSSQEEAANCARTGGGCDRLGGTVGCPKHEGVYYSIICYNPSIAKWNIERRGHTSPP